VRGSSHTAVCVVLSVLLLLVLGLPFMLRPQTLASPPAGVEPVPQGPMRKLIIISPHWEGIRAEFERAFSEWTQRHLGHATKLEWLDVGGTSDAVKYVLSEFKRTPDGINIDLFFGGGVDPYEKFKKEGLLHRCQLSQEVLARIPQQQGGMDIYDAEGRWFGTCMAGFGILYNRRVLSLLKLPTPQTWEDLGRPQYFTWVGSGDPRSSGSVHMVYETIAQVYGWEKGWGVIMEMSGNVRSFARGGSDVPKDCALGEIAMGLAIDVYARRQIAEAGADRMGFLMPEGLTVINPDAIGVLKGAPNLDLAVKFVEFVLSEDGQKLWLFKKGVPGGPKEFELDRMSVIPGLPQRYPKESAVPDDPFKWIGTFTYDSGKGSLRWAILNDLIGACLIDTHPELVAAWQRINNLPSDHPLRRDFLKPPISESEMLNLASSEWNKADVRPAVTTQWVREARERYRRIARSK
jgi:ABC-type Fe3+ transport system substrate-binding protein